ncbi:MAG: hypothetical protein ACQESS_08395 [Bacillota bacterium]
MEQKNNNRNRKSYLQYLLAAVLILLLIIMFFKLKDSYFKKIEMEQKLEKKEAALAKYKDKIKKKKLQNDKNNKKKSTAVISREDCLNELLQLLSANNLELISYDSEQKCLILNLKGSFSSILSFLEKIEKEKSRSLQCEEIKLKKENTTLYIYLQLKYLELMQNEK